ncbi:unnamed protein product [Acanthoscelides obtectus]|uniref:Mos1 transposase HTH domain-containing protein n=1 Tax=Acanthoscelides obtectus TaxID=200917 RepID=A0A9P0Q602_ACAOB|nr:unnamed protein product [Acanthoscelides obtectus]CAK1658522.1 Mariner Mos1 transposase [Acanthoscelides obtectus]
MPFLFSNQELADIHFVEYARRFPNRRHPTRSVFVRVHRQIIENGFENLQRDQNINVRQRRFTRMILREFDRDPTTSVRRVSGALGISASHVHRVLRNNHRRPYHLQPVQGLQPGDAERRIRFCQWILDRTDNNMEFLSNVLWTDESRFTRRGVVNFHNQHIWSHKNSDAVRERNFQHEFNVNVWIGIYRNRLFGPYLLPARLNAATHGSKIELNREHFRAIIYYNFQRQLSQQECLAELLSVFGNEAPHQSTISRWYEEFKHRHVTYREIEASSKISNTSIQKILYEELGVRKLVSRWIPHLCQKTLDRFNSGNSKNVYSIVSGDESWIYFIRSRSVSKKMVATFVSKAGHIATSPLNEQITVTADWYTTICLPKVITELRKINPERRIILHQDNASSHTAQKIRQYLTEENVELLDHFPYSPDLSPNDFFTFPKIKNRLRGQRFQSPEEAVDAFKNVVLDMPANEWNKYVAREVQVSKTKVWQTLREEGLVRFYESTFTSNGVNNFRNTHVWSVENPHAVRRAHFQQTFSVNVWAGMRIS